MTDAVQRLRSALADRYRIERELGQGGMATVYLAHDLKHGRKVAIKVLRPELAAVIGAERFLREIQTIATLQHPHILGLIDSGELSGTAYYVMPFVEGESLRDRLNREKQLPIGEAVRLATEVAAALDYAHRHGVIHRDIKPENVMLHDGSALVADFGIALAVSSAGGASRMTETGTSLGTPHYMSPEQAMGERVLTARSDVYALGAMTYEMLVGEPPFTGPTAQAIVARVVTEEPRPLLPQRRSIPAEVEDAVLTALQKLPADRFGSAAEFAAALGGKLEGRTVARTRAARPAWRLPALLGAALALAAILAVWGWARPSRAGPAPSAWRTEIVLPDSAQPSGAIDLSPDGTALVYAVGGAHPALWLRRAGTLAPVPLAGTADGFNPAFSPDGRRIAFNGPEGIRVVPREGGAPERVSGRTTLLTGIAWSDQDHLVIADQHGLARIPLGGGAAEPLTTVDTAAGDLYHGDAAAIPGGAILFAIAPKDLGDLTAYRIAILDTATRRTAVLMPGVRARYVPGHLLVVRADGTLLAVPFDPAHRRLTGSPVPVATGVTLSFGGAASLAVAPAGQVVYGTGSTGAPVRDFVRVRRDGKAAPADAGWSGEFYAVAISPDGRRVAAGAMTTTTEEIQVRDLASGALSRFSVPGTQNRNPVFSSDGAWVYFTAISGAEQSVYQKAPGSAAAPRLLFHTANAVPGDLALSADGHTLFYQQWTTAASDILARDLDHPAAPGRPIVATPAREEAPSPSPDGRWLAFQSDESGSPEVYVVPLDSARSDRWQISTAGGRLPRWSSDGRELFYLGSDSMMTVAVPAGPQFVAGSRHGLFSTKPFAVTDPAGYAVLPRNEGFLMQAEHPGVRPGRRFVLIERWDSGLAGGRP